MKAIATNVVRAQKSERKNNRSGNKKQKQTQILANTVQKQHTSKKNRNIEREMKREKQKID